ncbi:MAG TPA: MFS transporter [Baekduia sp.]|nr:MFS transporter [Baekduia sp.]
MTPHSSPRRPWSVLALLVVAQFMVILDITIVNVALPSIGRALDFTPSGLPWVVTTYVLCSGGLLLVGGRLADLVGRRRTFLAGLSLFTLASLACGLAPSAGTLIVARAFQGAGAALMTPSALAILTTTYVGAQRATALSIWGAVASAGVGIGVIAGGMLTTWLSWEWVFLVNVPVGVVTVALTPRVIPASAAAAAGGGLRDLDLPGAAAVVAGLVALVYAISGAADHGWASARTLGLGAVALLLLGAFAAIERRVARPLLAPAIWRVPTVTTGAVFMLCATGLMTGTFFLNSVYLQGVLGWSALETGLAFLPLVGAIGLGVHATSRAVARVGSRALIAGGLALVGAGALLLALAPDDARYAADVLPGLLVVGLGVGLAFPAVSIAAMSDVDHARAGSASGLLSTAHEVGAALGVAVLSSVAASGAGAAGFGAGYGDAFLVAAIVAGVLAALAVVAVPVVRPAPGAHVGVH